MNRTDILAVVGNTPKGANIICEWTRTAKVKKTCTAVIQKMVRAVGRVGIDYNNINDVQEKRENGELPAIPQPIWNGKGQWEIFPYLIKHVDTHALYVRLYNGTSATVKPHVQWLRDGKEVSFEEVENDLLASEKNKEHGDCFCCKIEDMTRIHNEVSEAPAVEQVTTEAAPAGWQSVEA
jgi:hypothetical protein